MSDTLLIDSITEFLMKVRRCEARTRPVIQSITLSPEYYSRLHFEFSKFDPASNYTCHLESSGELTFMGEVKILKGKL